MSVQYDNCCNYQSIQFKPTFRVCLLQCDVTGLHASHHIHYGPIDPLHKLCHVGIDIKHIILSIQKESRL